MVFRAGLPITMCGLDVTHQAQVMDEDIERVRAIPNPVAQCVAQLLDFFMISSSGSQSGDLLAHRSTTLYHRLVAGTLLFHGVECRVDIETCGTHTLGMTVVDRYDLTGRPANAWCCWGWTGSRLELLVQRLQTFG